MGRGTYALLNKCQIKNKKGKISLVSEKAHNQVKKKKGKISLVSEKTHRHLKIKTGFLFMGDC